LQWNETAIAAGPRRALAAGTRRRSSVRGLVAARLLQHALKASFEIEP